MILSDLSVTRPVLATVMSLLLVAIGLVAFDRLPLREYPDIDPPVVSIDTVYPGAAANVVETRITQLIEDRVSGVEGIRTIESVSEDGRSRITIEFDIDRDVDGAANDVRDRVSGILDQLPVEDRRRIRVLGPVDEAQKRDLLSAADVVAMPSRTDSCTMGSLGRPYCDRSYRAPDPRSSITGRLYFLPNAANSGKGTSPVKPMMR